MELNICFNCMREKKEPGPCPHCGFDESTYQPAAHHLRPGTILEGKYILGRVLGEGGFGITYVGWDLNLEMKVAVKEYYPNGFASRDHERTNTLTIFTGSRGEFFQKGLEKFVDEARRLAKFWGFPGIVSVKDYFQGNKTAYIVMEFVQGQTLKELLRQRPDKRLPAAEVFAMMRPVMQSLEEVHKAGLIHRDISPDNLMISSNGQVKLIDFGAARDFARDGEKSRSVLLKPGYAPSEQYRSRGNQGPWTDVYSLCATMYRAITGRVPEESLDRMEEDTLKRPSQLGIAIPDWQEEALLQGLAVFQRDRFQSVEALETALYAEPEETKNREENFHATQKKGKKDEETAGQQEKLPADPSRKKRRGPAVGAAAILLVILAICFLVPREERDNRKEEGQMQTIDAESEVSSETDSQESVQVINQETVSNSEMDEPVVWTDKNLERFIRQGLGKTEGDILKSDLADIRVLRIARTGVMLYESVEEDEGTLHGIGYERVKEEEAITSLKDLKYFPNLTVLQVSSHKGVDISALSGLDSLTNLDLDYNDLTDISALSGLTSLTSLSLTMNYPTDLSPLSGLTSLTSLDLGTNRLTDISALSSLTALTSLDLYSNDIADVTPLSGLTSLTSLDLGANELTDISPLANLTSLEELCLSLNERLSSLEPLSQLSNLKDLDIDQRWEGNSSCLAGIEGLDINYWD